jgi:hypothetical protein
MSAIKGRNSDIISLELVVEFPAEASRIFSMLGDIAQWPGNLEPRVLKSKPHSKIIVGLPDFSRPEFSISPNKDGCEVVLLHDLIKSIDDRKEYRKIWKAWLKSLEKRVSQ